MSDNSYSSMKRKPCGCPEEPWKFPYKCVGHAAQDGRIRMPEVRQDGWYGENTCYFCGRVNPYGLACQHVYECSMCGIRSCQQHRMACYLTKTICPVIVEEHKRTKPYKDFLAMLNALGGSGVLLVPNTAYDERDPLAWHSPAKRYLERLGVAEAAAHKAQMKRYSRKGVRYSPSEYHRALIEFLNKNDEEGFKALKLAEGRYSALGV